MPTLTPAEVGSTDLLDVRESDEFAAWLRHHGYDAANVEGGMLAWQRMGLPVEGVII